MICVTTSLKGRICAYCEFFAFGAGYAETAMACKLAKLKQHGIMGIMNYAAEDDVSGTDAKDSASSELGRDLNAAKFVDCTKVCDTETHRAFLELKACYCIQLYLHLPCCYSTSVNPANAATLLELNHKASKIAAYNLSKPNHCLYGGDTSSNDNKACISQPHPRMSSVNENVADLSASWPWSPCKDEQHSGGDWRQYWQGFCKLSLGGAHASTTVQVRFWGLHALEGKTRYHSPSHQKQGVRIFLIRHWLWNAVIERQLFDLVPST